MLLFVRGCRVPSLYRSFSLRGPMTLSLSLRDTPFKKLLCDIFSLIPTFCRGIGSHLRVSAPSRRFLGFFYESTFLCV